MYRVGYPDDATPPQTLVTMMTAFNMLNTGILALVVEGDALAAKVDGACDVMLHNHYSSCSAWNSHCCIRCIIYIRLERGIYRLWIWILVHFIYQTVLYTDCFH